MIKAVITVEILAKHKSANNHNAQTIDGTTITDDIVLPVCVIQVPSDPAARLVP